MSEGEHYEPTPEEIANAEGMMTDEERQANAEREAITQRKERFARNLENLESLDLEAVYPEELQKRSWDIIEKPEEIEQFYSDFTGDRPYPEVYSIYRDRETGQMFASFKNRGHAQIVLDLLFAHRQIAPWSPIKALVIQDEEVPIGESKKPARFESHHSVVKATSKVIEDIVNGLGDPKYTAEKKKGFLLTDIGSLIHEAVHSKNEPGISWADHLGPEADASLAEYLVTPGRNSKTDHFVSRGVELLRKQNGGVRNAGDQYSIYLMFGILALAEREGILPDENNAEGVATAIETMHTKICRMDRNELNLLRKRAESIFLSDEDEIIDGIIEKLKGKYPSTLNLG